MFTLYNVLVLIVSFCLKIVALFNNKIKLFITGRKHVYSTLQKNITPSDNVIWFHTASLGEFEQGLPVIKKVKQEFSNYKIVVTFFSPSGYEIKKNSPVADIITYLPLDTKSNVRNFLNKVNPKLAVFVKYEFWPNYLKELQKRAIPTVLISGIFRPSQPFFKWYGGFMKQSLKAFSHFFVQDNQSKSLLNSLGFNNVTVSGDTRFDRVLEIYSKAEPLDFVETFKNNQLCVVAGSTWPEDEKLLVDFINNSTNNKIKYIFAPHNIKPELIAKLKKSFSNKKVVLYTEKDQKNLADFTILIVDTIGLLTKIYKYADIAFVGGGVGNTGLHNTLEPAVYGVPIVIGNKYKNFKEARDLVAKGGIVPIKNQEELNTIFTKLINNPDYRTKLGNLNRAYVEQNGGSNIQIVHFIRKLL